jgi:hypothetical protein
MLGTNGLQNMTDLKERLAAVLASPEGQALIEQGREFSVEELQAAFAQVLTEVDGDQRGVIEAAFSALLARRANLDAVHRCARMRRYSPDGHRILTAGLCQAGR